MTWARRKTKRENGWGEKKKKGSGAKKREVPSGKRKGP